MSSSSPDFNFYFYPHEGLSSLPENVFALHELSGSAFSAAPAAASSKPDASLSCSMMARLLLLNAPAAAPTVAPTQSSTRLRDESALTLHLPRNSFYNGFECGDDHASALPPPVDDVFAADSEEAKRNETNLDEIHALQKVWRHNDLPHHGLPDHDALTKTASRENSSGDFQSALERRGYHVTVWPGDFSSHVNAKDLLPFDVVIVQSHGGDEATLKLCGALKNASRVAGASLLATWRGERNDEDARLLTCGFLEAGADGVTNQNAPGHEICCQIQLLAHLSRARRELQDTREQLRLQLQTDDLTNLLNRRFFFQEAHREYERAHRTDAEMSCLMIDLDHFRRLGEIFGFECCDAALRQVACFLRETAREGDIVARFGESKFVWLLPATSLRQAVHLGEKLQGRIARGLFAWQDQTLQLSVSVGEAARALHVHAPDMANHETRPLSETLEMRQPRSTREEVASLLEEADAALFVAKRGVRSASPTEKA